jgi:hypothetical protein
MKRRRRKNSLYSLPEWCALVDVGLSTMYRYLRDTKQAVVRCEDFSGPHRKILYYDEDLTRVLFEHR